MSVSISGGVSPTPKARSAGLPSDLVIPRDGDRDLSFRGWRLSQVKDCLKVSISGGQPLDRCTEVSVFLTEGKKLVTHVRRWTERAGEAEREEHKVGVHGNGRDPKTGRVYTFADAVAQAVDWLKKDNAGQLGSLSKRAWLEACGACPDLKGEDVERIE